MSGQSTHSKRRYGIGTFHSRYFVGRGLDVGGRPDPLINNAHAFRSITSLDTWEKAQGDAQFLAGVADSSYDFLHSSHVLEHIDDPRTALLNWIRVVRPGGYLILTVPDEDLYEHGFWPSRFNYTHKWSFTIYKQRSWNPGHSLNILDLCIHCAAVAEVEKVELIRDFFNEGWPPEVDQTAQTRTAECVIELILQKR